MANEIITRIKNTMEGDDMRNALMKALPKAIPVEKLIQISITAITKTPKLMQCDPATIYKSVMECAQLGLIPDGILGHAYFVPFKGQCQMIPGYRGLISLAVRSGKVVHVFADNVFANDTFKLERGAFPVLEHAPTLREEPGEYVGSYSVAHLVDSPKFPAFEFMRADQVEKIRDGSSGYQYHKGKGSTDNPWISDEDEMRKKTAIRRLCKFLPLSPEALTAVMRSEYLDAGVLDAHLGKELTPGNHSFSFPSKGRTVKPAQVESVETTEDDKPPLEPGEKLDEETGEIVDDPDANPFPTDEEPETKKQGKGREYFNATGAATRAKPKKSAAKASGKDQSGKTQADLEQERAELIAKYIDVCQSYNVETGNISRLTNATIAKKTAEIVAAGRE